MRVAARVLVISVVFVCSREAAATEAGSSWWPFGQHAAAATAPSTSASHASEATAAAVAPSTNATAGTGAIQHEVQMPTTPSANDDSHGTANSSKKKFAWPSLHMPALSSKPAAATTTSPKAEANKNKWVDKPAVTPKTSPMDPVKKGAHSVAEGTKSAWHKTVAAVTPGSTPKKPAAKPAAKPAPRIASRETSPPFWKKMFGAKEPEMQQPQTVPQWMAQKRLDP